jgi:Domain of unknown function (DUF4129)
VLQRLAADIGDLLGLHTPALGRLLQLGALAALVVGAVVLAVRLLPRRRRASPRVAAAAAPPAAYAVARAAALDLADRDPREALRLLYAAALGELSRRRGLRARPGRTNWGFVRALGPSTPQAGALAECTRLFERCVYGDVPVAAADVHRADGLAEAMLS